MRWPLSLRSRFLLLVIAGAVAPLAVPSEGVLEDVLLDLHGIPPYLAWDRRGL